VVACLYKCIDCYTIILNSEEPDIETCTILTTTANSLLQPIHDRIPAILSSEDYGRLLAPNVQGGQPLSDLLRPFSDAPMQAIPVSTRVNSAKIDDELCIEMLSTD
jgi:putative SOS response-associated peptidase YedK